MLVLSRQPDETVIADLGDGRTLEVMVVEVRGDRVRLGFTAPKEITIHRKEVVDAIARENRAAAKAATPAV